MKYEQFLSLLKDCAKYGKGDGTPLSKFKGFAVIRHSSDLEAENWSKTIVDKDHFYSETWEKQGRKPGSIVGSYPVLVASPLSFSEERAKGKDCWSFEFAALYPDHAQLGENVKLYCKKVRLLDIYPGMRKLLASVDNFLLGIALGTIGGVEVWHHKEILKEMNGGVIPPVNEVKTGKWIAMLNRENKVVRGMFADDLGNNALCGVRKTISVCVDCFESTFEISEDCCPKWDGSGK